VKALRDGSSPDCAVPDPRDVRSWHLLGVRQCDRRVVGAMRTRLYELAGSGPHAHELFSYCDVSIRDADTRQIICDAIAEYVDRQRMRSSFFYQVGGFAVDPRHRGTVLASLLGLGVAAWIQEMGLNAGCAFCTTKGQALSLNGRFGAIPLRRNGTELPGFFCEYHGVEGKFLGMEAGGYESRLTPTVTALRSWLRETTVLVNNK
jgi:hypothetical protein